MHADDVSNMKDFGMVFQLLAENTAADPLIGLVSDLYC